MIFGQNILTLFLQYWCGKEVLKFYYKCFNESNCYTCGEDCFCKLKEIERERAKGRERVEQCGHKVKERERERNIEKVSSNDGDRERETTTTHLKCSTTSIW